MEKDTVGVNDVMKEDVGEQWEKLDVAEANSPRMDLETVIKKAKMGTKLGELHTSTQEMQHHIKDLETLSELEIKEKEKEKKSEANEKRDNEGNELMEIKTFSQEIVEMIKSEMKIMEEEIKKKQDTKIETSLREIEAKLTKKIGAQIQEYKEKLDEDFDIYLVEMESRVRVRLEIMFQDVLKEKKLTMMKFKTEIIDDLQNEKKDFKKNQEEQINAFKKYIIDEMIDKLEDQNMKLYRQTAKLRRQEREMDEMNKQIEDMKARIKRLDKEKSRRQTLETRVVDMTSALQRAVNITFPRLLSSVLQMEISAADRSSDADPNAIGNAARPSDVLSSSGDIPMSPAPQSIDSDFAFPKVASSEKSDLDEPQSIPMIAIPQSVSAPPSFFMADVSGKVVKTNLADVPTSSIRFDSLPESSAKAPLRTASSEKSDLNNPHCGLMVSIPQSIVPEPPLLFAMADPSENAVETNLADVPTSSILFDSLQDSSFTSPSADSSTEVFITKLDDIHNPSDLQKDLETPAVDLLSITPPEINFDDFFYNAPTPPLPRSPPSTPIYDSLKEGYQLETYLLESLHDAACKGTTEELRMLIDAGVEINAVHRVGYTALHMAAQRGNMEMVTLLLDAGARLDIKDLSGWSPLTCAALYGRDSVLKLFLEHGADLEEKDLCGWTPLHWAARNGFPLCVQILVDAGFDPNAKNTQGNTPLDIAVCDSVQRILRPITY